jgi:perosamine synthetase
VPTFSGKEYVNQTIDSTFVFSVGAFVDQFERSIAQISNTEKAVAVVNCTAGSTKISWGIFRR